MSMIRNISQTVQEREIVKTAPDIVVYLDGLPYLLNYFIDDQKTNTNYSIVNFNDYVTSYNASYDTDIMIPNASIGLQVPNYFKHKFVMPGGNNLIQTMMEVQVFAKGYFLATNSDTVYRRVFKGIVSHISYNDNGKTLEISIQCYGSLHLLELMQINLNPSVQYAPPTGVANTFWQTIFGDKNPYEILAAMFVYGLNSAGFQQTNLGQSTPAYKSNTFNAAVQNGYIAKWQAILTNVAKEVHIYGTAFKDHPDKTKTKPSDVAADRGMDKLAANNVYLKTQTDPQQWADIYYSKIRQWQPEATITSLSLLNNQIVSRMEYIRKIIQAINFEGYQDIDGKIIIKPPAYNLDVTNLGTPNVSTSAVPAAGGGSGDPYSSASNPLTEITAQTNPFIIYLSEILTENETEDQAAIRKTRTAVHGNANPHMNIGYLKDITGTAQWIDIPKLQKFGLREEPTIEVPWLYMGDNKTLFTYAVAETVRANRGYRTYTVTIPMRPELKLGFPIYFPHKDIYGYIKSVNIAYQVGGTATMTIMCDSIRRRVTVPQPAITSTGAPYTRYVSQPNLVYQFTKGSSLSPMTTPNPNQSPGNSLQYFQTFAGQAAQGSDSTGAGSQNPNSSQNSPANPVGKVATTTITPDLVATTQDNILQTQRAIRIASEWTVQPDTATNSYTIQPDTASVFNHQRPADNSYFVDLQKGTIPFTDQNGYEVLAPLPWGRWQTLIAAIKEFTQDGYVIGPTDVNGNPTTNEQDTAVLNATQSFLFAGLGTPTSTANPSNQLTAALAQLQNQADTDTVIVLDYSGGQSSNDTQLLNAAQPDIQNAATTQQLSGTTTSQQQLVNVLVSGTTQPNTTALTTLQQVSSPAPGTGATPTPTQASAQNPTITPDQSSAQTQDDDNFEE